MKVTHEREGNIVTLNVEVDVEKVSDAMDKAYKKVRKDVKVPGFRKGRVPRRILEARFGKEVLYKDALDILLPQAYGDAIDEAGIDPIDQPDIEDVHIEKDEPCTFTAKVQVKPEVELGEYTGLDVEKEEVEVSDEDVERELNTLQQRHTQLQAVDREEVKDGDYAIIDFEGFMDGEPFEGGSGEEYALEIGSGTFIPGFEDQLVGVKVGEEVEIDVTFPEDYNAEHLAGQPVTFKVTVNEIKEKQVPELDDEFAKEASEFETLDELKEDIINRLKEQASEQINRKFENELVDAAASNAEIDVPEVMIDSELDQMFQSMSMNLQQQGIPLDKYLEYTGSSVEDWKDENRENAEKRVRGNLTLEAIAEKEGITITDEELDNRIAEMAEQNDQEPEQFKQFLMLQGTLDNLSKGMKMEKVIEFLAEKNEK